MTDPGGMQPYPSTAPAAPGAPDEGEERQLRRAEPRLTTSLAGAGMALVIFGVLVWGGDYLEPGAGDGDTGDNRELGTILSLATVVIGYLLAIRFRRGPLATAGVVASALGIPVLLGFLTWDSGRVSGDAFEPIQLNLVVLVSIAAWVATYLLVPGARGHGFLIGLAASVLWLYVLEETEHVVSVLPAFLFLGFFFGDGPELPDFTTVAIISLVFGAVYYGAAAMLDRDGRHGAATPFVVAGFPATLLGIVSFVEDGEAIGTGAVFVVVGAVLCAWGATAPGRRFTTWVWALGIAVGLTIIVADLFDDNAAGGGATLIAVGVLVVAFAATLRGRIDEPDDMTPGPSRYERTRLAPLAQPAYGQAWTPPPSPEPPQGSGWPAPASPPPDPTQTWGPPSAPSP